MMPTWLCGKQKECTNKVDRRCKKNNWLFAAWWCQLVRKRDIRLIMIGILLSEASRDVGSRTRTKKKTGDSKIDFLSRLGLLRRRSIYFSRITTISKTWPVKVKDERKRRHFQLFNWLQKFYEKHGGKYQPTGIEPRLLGTQSYCLGHITVVPGNSLVKIL